MEKTQRGVRVRKTLGHDEGYHRGNESRRERTGPLLHGRGNLLGGAQAPAVLTRVETEKVGELLETGQRVARWVEACWARDRRE